MLLFSQTSFLFISKSDFILNRGLTKLENIRNYPDKHLKRCSTCFKMPKNVAFHQSKKKTNLNAQYNKYSELPAALLVVLMVQMFEELLVAELKLVACVCRCARSASIYDDYS